MPGAHPDRRMLTLPMLAAELGLGPRKLRELIRTGELIAHNFARPGAARPRYAISREAVEAFLQRRQVIPIDSLTPSRQRRRRVDDSVKQFV